VIRRLIAQRLLPAAQVATSAPWIIARSDLSLPVVHAQVQAVRQGRGLPKHNTEHPEFPWNEGIL
jgi:hypothetical protein